MQDDNKLTLFDEIAESLNAAGIVYHSQENLDGSPSGDRGPDAVEIFCSVIEKRISEAKIEVIQAVRKGCH